MQFIGDVHGHFDEYKWIVSQCYDDTFQVGDLGIFREPDMAKVPESSNNLFIRGNHDNPALCRKHPNYLGDFGYLDTPDIFFVSGAYSIDQDWRTPGYDWWRDEELNTQQFKEARQLYNEKKPSIVVSHDCPLTCQDEIRKVASLIRINSHTPVALDGMFEDHQPDVWIFGHYHIRFNQTIQGTKFICVNILDSYEIPGLHF